MQMEMAAASALTTLDWAVLALALGAMLAVGFAARKRASGGLVGYLLGGRALPWWVAGASMAATTLAADTPLAVTELVRKHGLAGNWLWWSMLLSGVTTAVFFAHLWRRTGGLTDLEFLELRYSGLPARVLRIFRAWWMGLVLNVLIMGWVNRALLAILGGMLGLTEQQQWLALVGLMVLTTLYVGVSGLAGVTSADVLQFLLAMGGSIWLAVEVLGSPEIGGWGALVERLPENALRVSPVPESALEPFTLGMGAFLAMFGLQWWASWYPGAEPGGGGYVVQRLLATRNERHATGAALFFQFLHYLVRPWPWIVVALSALVLYPELDTRAEAKQGFILAMRDHLSAGGKGLLLAAFVAAYMSTLSTHLNWGTSYLMHDAWGAAWRGRLAGRPVQAVRYSQLVTVGLMAVSLGVTLLLQEIADAWMLLLEMGAGIGLVLMLRWYWWRINAWSELAATVIPPLVVLVCVGLQAVLPEQLLAEWSFWLQYPGRFYLTVGCATLGWLLVLYLTPPEEPAVLLRFIRTVQPQGWWGPYRQQAAQTQAPGGYSLLQRLLQWVAALVFLLGVLLAIARGLAGAVSEAAWLGGMALVALAVLGLAYRRAS